MMKSKCWLDGFLPDEVLRVVNGYPQNLGKCFIWEDTDQGHAFWASQRDNGLDIEGAKALLEMVKYWKENK